ncbi:MAG: hypothetical protein QOF57_1464 [Frankiaceae bacterium]|jgi:hypothetical protein|nr:hypothetical protein [Frankiaceae bacterium]MDQ1727503.1 hypothetical protein [Frankiaceae bacterium]
MKFLVLYNAAVSARDQMANASAAEAQAGMDAWSEWAAAAGDGVVDLGVPVEAERRLTSSGTSESTSSASGYSILQADSVNQVSDLLRKHPHLQMPGSSIDVFEMLAMPGM